MIKRKLLLPYTFIILAVTVIFGTTPDYNWDMLPYMAILKKMDGVTLTNKIHTDVYNTARKNLPENKFNSLVDEHIPYRKLMAENASAFQSQLVFFDVKPIYLTTAFLFYKLGVSLTYATVLPSLIAFFLINLISFWWCKEFNLSNASLLLILAIICIITIPLATRSNPDTLACMFLLISSYLFLESTKLFNCVIFLILSILTRPENIIFSFLLFIIVFTGKWKKKIPIYVSAGYLFIMAIVYFLIVKNANYPGWSSLFYHAFINNTVNPAIKQTITVSQYFGVLKANLLNIKGIIAIAGSILLSAFVFLYKNSTKSMDGLYKLFYAIVLVWAVAKTLLFPMTGLRFIIPAILLLLFVVVKKYESILKI